MVQLRGDLTKKMEDGAGKVRFRRWKNMTIGARISLVILIAIIVVAALADFIAPYSPYEIFTSFCAPDSAHLFGTDDKGRDVMSRLMCGAKYSLVIGLGATGFALVVGSIIGAIAAVVRPRIANVIMRILDIIMSFPGIALAATFIVVFGNSVPSLIFAIGFLYIPQIARIVRANVMSEYNQDYVRAVVVSGARAPWILWKHVVRNCVAPVLVFTIVLVADAIVFEASLAFISAGIPEPTPTWGNILADARNGVLAGRWWQALFPGIMIMLTVLCLNIVSEGITDAIAAPKSAVKVDENDLNKDREADRMVADPTLAYAAQADMLNKRLAALKEAELTRTDRFEARTDVPPILEVKDLCIKFPRHGDVNVVDHVSFVVRPRQTMGLVGESGCGKSTTGRTILRLGGEKTGGQVLFNGKEVYDMTSAEMRELRTKMQIIFQDPFSSLSPRLPVGEIIGEAVREHNLVPKNEFNDYIDQVMDDCGLQPYHKTRYPHEFSGGQRQRICIARALALNPEFVVCDEPVSALDVSIQAQIINLLKNLQEKRNLTYLFISHDLSVVEHISDTVGVMYLGNLVEYGETDDIFAHPLHPYTKALFSAIPIPDPTVKRERIVLQGSIPSPANPPSGCKFHTRCPYATERCKTEAPKQREVEPGHYVVCHLHEK